eukprot:1167155_1
MYAVNSHRQNAPQSVFQSERCCCVSIRAGLSVCITINCLSLLGFLLTFTKQISPFAVTDTSNIYIFGLHMTWPHIFACIMFLTLMESMIRLWCAKEQHFKFTFFILLINTLILGAYYV